MADKPSRGLVLYGEGLARFITPDELHLHSFASHAYCGLLSLPHLSPSSSENEDASVIWELGQLLDASESLVLNPIFDDKQPAFPSVADRFMGMKAAIVTDKSTVKSLGEMLGFKVLNWNDDIHASHPSSSTSNLLKLLGFQDSPAFDLVIAHVGSGQNSHIKLMDHLVGDLSKAASSEPEVGSRLHISVVLSYGAPRENDHSEFSFSHTETRNKNGLFPLQSYQTKAGKLREDVREFSPMLVAQYQEGVTRFDAAESFSFREFVHRSGSLVIPADRFIHEVAFKLWKAPKYGA